LRIRTERCKNVEEGYKKEKKVTWILKMREIIRRIKEANEGEDNEEEKGEKNEKRKRGIEKKG
jgi:hypothetical protein